MKKFLGSLVVVMALFVHVSVAADGGSPTKQEPAKPTAPVVEKREAKRCIFAYALLPFKWVLCSTSRTLAYLHNTHPKKFYTTLALMFVGGGVGAYCALNNCSLFPSDDSEDKKDDSDNVPQQTDIRYVRVGR